jgi:hypothetical protein
VRFVSPLVSWCFSTVRYLKVSKFAKLGCCKSHSPLHRLLEETTCNISSCYSSSSPDTLKKGLEQYGAGECVSVPDECDYILMDCCVDVFAVFKTISTNSSI